MQRKWVKVLVLLIMSACFAGCGDDSAIHDKDMVDVSNTDTAADSTEDASEDVPEDAPEDMGTDVAEDTAGDQSEDTPPDVDPCATIDCGVGGMCVAGTCMCSDGYRLDNGTCVEEGPCDTVTCGANSQCNNGLCVCTPGFVLDGENCIAPPPGDIRARTQDEVCMRWTTDYPTTTSDIHTSPAGMCNPGEINVQAHDDAMRRLNLYRWLVGVDPADVDWTNQEKAQQAALMMDVNNALDHSPPMNWQCYTAAGAEAAGSSNLALGYSNPADTVDGYMRDGNTPALGHRRWCITPALGDVGFGHYGRGGAMWAFGSTNGATEPEFIAYPAPGFFPIDAVKGVWSFSRRTGLGDSSTVTITRVSDNANVAVQSYDAGSTYGFINTLGIAPDAAMITAGETYRVEVVDGNDDWTYETTLVNCN